MPMQPGTLKTPIVNHQPQLVNDQALQLQEQARRKRAERRSPGKITMVVSDLMAFVEVNEGGSAKGLVFKTEDIEGYRGETLEELGVKIDARVNEVIWDSDTLLVYKVRLLSNTTPSPMHAT